MKKTAIVLGSSLALLAGGVVAELKSASSTKIYTNIVSNVAVQAADAVVKLDDQMFGEFAGHAYFNVESNSEQVSIAIAATNLYKGHDPKSEVPAIELTGVAEIDVPGAGAAGALGPTVSVDLMATDMEGDYADFAWMKSDYVLYDSSQNGYFERAVKATVYWDIKDKQKTTGEYSGYIKLWAMIPGADDSAMVAVAE